jgi:hypothetical protein
MATPERLTPSQPTRRARGSANELAPLALCVGAALAAAFTPVLIWRFVTGDWVCLNDWDTAYYLRLAAQAYHHRTSYMSDAVVRGGVTGYPWLPFVPAILLARIFDAGPFAVAIIWISLSAIGIGSGLYFIFRHFLKWPWIAAGCAVLCLSDFGFAERPFANQLRMLGEALWFHPAGLITIPWGRVLHWRVPDPGLDLPFLLFQILALARARERPTRLNLALSGLAFGLLFYVFFYCWTMAMTGLCIAFLLDRGARRVYAITLFIGSAIGLPQLLYTIHLGHLASAEALNRLGLFVTAPRLYEQSVPALFILAMAAAALWIWKSKRLELAYIWSLVAGGILLSRSRMVSGVFFHEYHYGWLWTPIWLVLMLIVAVSIARMSLQAWPGMAAICWAAAIAYFAAGVYLAAICVTRTAPGVAELHNYMRYKAQRLTAGPVRPLVADATIAGDDRFCELASIAEYQVPLDGPAVPISMAISDDEWESRAALNAYLAGTDRAEFEKTALASAELWFWESPGREREVIAALMRKFDEIVRGPEVIIAQFGVRYVALAADKPQMAYLRGGWTMLQQGPYWQIWERGRKAYP